MQNAYPEKPIVPYEHTTVAMVDVVIYLASLPVATNVKRAAYVVFRIESANGKSGVNNNYIGAQADGSRWPSEWDDKISGVVDEDENGGRERLFVAFYLWQTSVELLASRLQSRGIYIGGHTNDVTDVSVDTESDLVTAYYREWVTGNAEATAPPELVTGFESMYGQSIANFPGEDA